MSPRGWKTRAFYQQTLSYKFNALITSWNSTWNSATNFLLSCLMFTRSRWLEVVVDGMRLSSQALGQGCHTDTPSLGGETRPSVRMNCNLITHFSTVLQFLDTSRKPTCTVSWAAWELSKRFWLCCNCWFMCWFPQDTKPLKYFSPWIHLYRLIN